jgi:two-component system, sensor histidine kinase and response regulator
MADEQQTTLRVLVCDDEPGMRTGVARALQRFSVVVPGINDEVRFEVSEAESGEDAVAMLEKSTPDILLLDHKLPGMSGLDVLDAIAEKKLSLLTIMITAYASIETAVRATKQGAYDFLAKPFTPIELKNAVRKASEHVVVAQQARKLAQEKRQVRFQFISVLAHELQAPLGAVQGYLEVMKDNPGIDPQTIDDMINRCVVRTSGMQKMIADLLDLTRIESGQKNRELTDVDVCAVARMAIDTARPQAGEKGVCMDLHESGPVMMRADQSEIEIILNNLVTNAIKYNRDGGRVDVRVEADRDFVTIAVTDTGIGLAEEESARLFHDFVRIKNKSTRNILGSGLGLSIVKKLAQLYRGSVHVKSRPGIGSTFTVVLAGN